MDLKKMKIKKNSFLQDFPHFQVSIFVGFLGDVIEISVFWGWMD